MITLKEEIMITLKDVRVLLFVQMSIWVILLIWNLT